MPRSCRLLLSFSLLAALAGCTDPSPTFVFDAGTSSGSDASDAPRLDAGPEVSEPVDAADDAADAEGGAPP